MSFFRGSLFGKRREMNIYGNAVQIPIHFLPILHPHFGSNLRRFIVLHFEAKCTSVNPQWLIVFHFFVPLFFANVYRKSSSILDHVRNLTVFLIYGFSNSAQRATCLRKTTYAAQEFYCQFRVLERARLKQTF